MIIREVQQGDALDATFGRVSMWMGQDRLHRLLGQARKAGWPIRAWVAVEGDSLVGYAVCLGFGVATDGYGLTRVLVPESLQGKGIGSQLWRTVMEFCPRDIPGVMGPVDSADERTLEVIRHWGYRLGPLHVESAFDLADDGASWLTYEIASDFDYRNVEEGSAAWAAYGDFFRQLMADAPDAGEGQQPMPDEVIETMAPARWQHLIAWDGDVPAAFTAVIVQMEDDRVLNTMMTGVARAYRGRGLSRSVKLAHARALREAGWQKILTQNMETNAPMLATNKSLGFVPQMSYHDVILDFAT